MSELLDMGLPMLVTSFGYLIMTYMDVVMIGIFLPTSDVGVYSAALRAAMVMGIPLNIF